MEFDQVLKQLEWLNDERRKDKDIIAKQEERITAMEGGISAANQQIKDLSGEITRLSAVVGRMDEFDSALLQVRLEINQQIDEMDKQTKKREEEMEKVRRVEMRSIDTSFVETRQELEAISGINRSMKARVDEEARLAKQLDDLRIKVQDIQRSEEEYIRTYRLMEDGRRQDSKRLVDLQGEVSALRKRSDEQRGQAEIVSSNLRKVEGRLTETLAQDSERQEAQNSFIEKQALQQVEFERTWKEWQAKIEKIDRQSSDVEKQFQSLDSTHSEVKRLKGSIEELQARVERRINEITEVQRLAEERFRQEWVTFKADDQKRWTNYTLTQEEQRNELSRNLGNMGEQLMDQKLGLQEIQDIFHQVNEETEKRLQSLLSMTHDWVAAYERIAGNSR
jgi:DNA repair exonuclease SbcCD ATPase subunit